MNRNLQYPCPEDVMDMARVEALAEISKKTPFPKWMTQTAAKLKEVSKLRNLTPGEREVLQSLRTSWNEWRNKILSDESNKALIKEIYDRVQAREQASNPRARPVRKFPDMIKEWEEKCRAANVNFIALNTEFPREDYQNGINGKPLFIKKILDAVKPRGVLYIDGDMWIHKYPHIFDMPNVDFMARGWNMDPRSKAKAIATPFYDPYTFETSGGTMYFGNTDTARALLDKWAAESVQQVGKADDRILSQVFTRESMVLGTNIVNLPIEYLWLTDLYESFLKSQSDPASLDDAYIEHPYCLTGEERATDQGASANRTPANYDEEVIDNINYKRSPELFYEYIFFDGNEEMRNGFGRYLKYMKDAKNGYSKEPLIQLVDFSNKYGDFNAIATKNLEEMTSLPSDGKLPLTATIPQILGALYAGNDVELGGSVPNIKPEDEFVAKDASTKEDGLDMYTRKIRIDVTSPMFLSSKNPMIIHLLAMCETLADINKHVGTYLFMSRIRWNLYKTETEETVESVVKEGVDFKPIVHQIWFGGEIPEWRQKIFDANKSVCEKNGFKYSLWRNADRTKENFPQTFDYQEAALKAGAESGQSRWAQVADLARLEIVYNSSGIYIDSLIEISPTFLQAVVDAIHGGAEFVGCNEDECDPPLDCKNSRGEMYLTNSFFAATRSNPIFKRLLSPESLDDIDMENTEINHTTGPYFLRSGIRPEDKVFLFKSDQVYQFNQQETPYKGPTPNRFLFREPVKGAIKVKDGMYYLPGGIQILQSEFLIEKKGPLAIYHSGLGGTWST
jgi:hypothetical protein